MKLPSVYDPKEYEDNIYALWEGNNVFVPRDSKETFTVIMPPPNANADLHLGHAYMNAVQDTLVRYYRLKGRAALYVPGADHAGFETQVVFEKHLAKEGKSRFDFSRDELYGLVWDFVQKNKGGFERQLRRLGASCDWSRFTFTLDNQVIETAYETFRKMWDDKLIYRGERIVNFCTFHGTSFADIEVVYKEEPSKLWHIRYPIKDSKESVVVATTRPETMLGDTAVAVNPKDARYKDMVGKTVVLPITGREVPIIADDYVDKDFGSGAVKITPAHDPNDFDIGTRHKLSMIEVIDPDGKLGQNAPEKFRGLTVVEARDAVVAALEAESALQSTEDYTHSVGVCYKCGTVIEPLVRDQWFINMKPLAKEAIKKLNDNKITFYPASKKKEVVRYLESVRDWNISRQIAWGIPIPAFQNVEDPNDWIFNTEVKQTEIEVDGKKYRRDPDVFDTWFSSGQWPFVTLGYPDSKDYKHFYPTDLMETGIDILFQWVARMICLGLYITDDIPFKTVYLHGMVRSPDGRKMSKSLGNTVALEEVIDEHGSDALRMGILAGRSPGYSAAYAPMKVVGARNFCNKLWNVARFIESKVGDNSSLKPEAKPNSSADHWILLQLEQCLKKVEKEIEQYRLSEAYETLYRFIWDDFADWYIEASKVQTNESLLAYVLETVLGIAHPFAPFVTETIWQTLPWKKNTILAASDWPKAASGEKKLAADFEEIKNIVSEARLIISQLQTTRPQLYYTNVPFIQDNAELLIQLAGLGGVNEVRDGHGLFLTQTTYTCWLDIDKETALHYLDKLKAQQTEQQTAVTRFEQRLANKSYVSHAPKDVIDQTRQQLLEAQTLLANINKQIETFSEVARNEAGELPD